MTKTSVKAPGLIAWLGALLLVASLIGCAAHNTEDTRALKSGSNESADQHMEDSRTAESVREALAAGAEYRYDGVSVTANHSVIRLTGFVATSGQRDNAEKIAAKVGGVKGVENHLSVKD
jgi:hyperosmotically inducible protein